ncbi:hypothetical protein ABZX90_41520 [Streptomyces sp. NPDC002935]|uniref:hypothetical protein n=1 Tax=Streptomyces sp. NPDC002935 TaxID=3154545 RepID=UPI0033A2B7FE
MPRPWTAARCTACAAASLKLHDRPSSGCTGPSPQLLWALAAPDPAEGPQHPARNFSLRFITAYVNGDLPTCQALHQAAASAGPQGYEHFLKALIAGVSHLTRVALEEQTANGETPAQHPY